MFSRRDSYEWTAAPGRIYELTDPPSRDMHGIAWEFSDALDREVTYSDISRGWERELTRKGLPVHLTRHLLTMAKLHRAGRCDRLAGGVEWVSGRIIVRKSNAYFRTDYPYR